MPFFFKKINLLQRYLLIQSGLKENLDPSFFIIGAQKSGTTSLFKYLQQYATNFVSPIKKEIHYYDYLYYKGLTWYKSHYPFKNKYNQPFFTGEASPYYLFHPVAPQRLYEDFPKAKFLVLLRNPVDRAYSHYKFKKKHKIGPYESYSFEEAIKVEEERLAGEEEKLKKSSRYRGVKHQYYSYLSRGRYVEQLRKWFKYFSRDQFLILQSEEFFSNTEQTLSKVFSWVGLRRQNSFSSFNIKNSTKYAQLDEDLRKKISRYYDPYNKKLFNLIDKKFDWD